MAGAIREEITIGREGPYLLPWLSLLLAQPVASVLGAGLSQEL